MTYQIVSNRFIIPDFCNVNNIRVVYRAPMIFKPFMRDIRAYIENMYYSIALISIYLKIFK